ncbi:MAG: Rne/Rng family ribonuclease, partial [Solirubrobacteraceae bacterium]
GLVLVHFAITFSGTREEVEERALPFRPGDEVLVEIVEPHMYDVDDAVAKIDGYIISIAGAAPHVGEKRMVRIDEVGRTAASALLLDDAGEVVAAPARPTRGQQRQPARAGRSGESRSGSRGRRRTASADREDAEARAEAGLAESSAAIEEEPDELAPSGAAEAPAASGGQAGEEGEDGLQSKPRRRGRRGGRRRSAAKAKAAE